MNRRVLVCTTALLVSGLALSHAIPPPWTLEEAKAKADLIMIAKAGKAEDVKDVRGLNARVAVKPAKILKGAAGEEGQPAKLFVLFAKPEQPKAPGGPVAVQMGGTGRPEPVEGETSLIFLKKHAKKGHCTVVCGKFGYIPLVPDAKTGMEGLKKRIDLYRGWCKRISDEKLREAMDRYYQETLEFLDQKAEK